MAEAEDAICDAWDTVYKSIQTAGSKSSTDETLTFALGVELKLTFHAAGDYLQRAVDKNPAASEALRTATNDLASAYQRAILAQLADATPAHMDEIRSDIGSAETEVRQECE